MREDSAKPDHPKSFAFRLRSAFFKRFISREECADLSIVADRLDKPLASRLLWAIRSRAATIKQQQATIRAMQEELNRLGSTAVLDP